MEQGLPHIIYGVPWICRYYVRGMADVEVRYYSKVANKRGSVINGGSCIFCNVIVNGGSYNKRGVMQKLKIFVQISGNNMT